MSFASIVANRSMFKVLMNIIFAAWLTANIVTGQVFLTWPDLDFMIVSTVQLAAVMLYLSLGQITFNAVINNCGRKNELIDVWHDRSPVHMFLHHVFLSRFGTWAAAALVAISWFMLGVTAWAIGLSGDDYAFVMKETIVGDFWHLGAAASGSLILILFGYGFVRTLINKLTTA